MSHDFGLLPLCRKGKDTAPECLQEVWETSIHFLGQGGLVVSPQTDKINPPWWGLREIQLLVVLPGNQDPREGLDSPDQGKRGVKEQGRPKSPIHSHTHIWNVPQQGGSPKSLLGEQRRVWDDRHFKQQKSWSRATRKTIGTGGKD